MLRLKEQSTDSETLRRKKRAENSKENCRTINWPVVSLNKGTMIYVYLNACELHNFFPLYGSNWMSFKMHAQVQLYLNFSHCDHYCHGAFQIKLSSYSFSLHLNEICMRFFCVYYFLMRMSIDNDDNVQQITTKYSTKC